MDVGQGGEILNSRLQELSTFIATIFEVTDATGLPRGELTISAI